ncbi:MAG: hypothetical protein VZR02_07860 [Lachnospiraceae bacterium]|nr:hypothetical protein [Lachnospiraceae bacterium]
MDLDEMGVSESSVFDMEMGAFDRYAFCVMGAAEADCEDCLRKYLAELVFCVAGDDLELCTALFKVSYDFMRDPLETFHGLVKEKCRSDGTKFSLPGTEDDIQSRLWEAQYAILAPACEKFRAAFSMRHLDAIFACLPFDAGHGDNYTNAEDVALIDLVKLCDAKKIKISEEEYLELRGYKDALEGLHHRGILYIDSVRRLLDGVCGTHTTFHFGRPDKQIQTHD